MALEFLGMAGQKTNRGWVGLEVSRDGIAIAHVLPTKAKQTNVQQTNAQQTNAQQTKGDRPRLSCCEFIATEAITSTTETLRARISALGLTKVPCNWVLVNPDYNLLLVEAPKVADEELREAMRWRIKDLISFPVENAVLDVFPLPGDGTRGAPMSYVVVAEKNQIQDIIDIADSAKIVLSSIDIGELALRNLADLVTADNRGVGLVRLRQGQGSLALIKQQQLYLSRQFDLPYNAGLLDELPEENLVLELQRSVDYYERQLGQVPPAQLLFCGENISTDKLTESFRQSLPGKSNCLQLSTLVEGAEQWEESLLQLCAGAIGGALRQEVAA